MKITKRQLRQIIREAAKDYATMAYDYKMWAKHEFRASHLEPSTLVAYARGLDLDRTDVEELAVTLGMPPAVRRRVMTMLSEAKIRQVIREAFHASSPMPAWNAPLTDLEAWWAYELGDPNVRVERRSGRGSFSGTGGMMSRGDALPVMTVKSKQFEGGYLELTPPEWSQIAREQENNWEY